MAQQEDGGGLAGFVPLDSLQRPARWADDGEDEGSPFAPQPPSFARSASGQLQVSRFGLLLAPFPRPYSPCDALKAV